MIPPLSAYAARSCPTRTHFDVVRPVTPEPPDTLQRMLAEAGLAHEQHVFDTLRRANPRAVVIDRTVDAKTRVRLTRDAMRDGAPLILGGRLVDDMRVGEPDVLIHAEVNGTSGYAPIEVKTHQIETTTPSGARTVTQPLTALAWPDTEPRNYGRQSGATRRTLIQLAHYQAQLEAAGFACDAEPWVGIIGTDLTAVWFCLDDPIGRHDDATGVSHNPVSVNEIYHLEFAFRRAIAKNAGADADAVTVSRLAPPVRNPECPHCPWRRHCNGLWEARDDVSLLPRVDRHVWTALAKVGLDTIGALAGYDTRHHVTGFTHTTLQGLADQARARTGAHPVYLRRGVDTVMVPRADVEVDIDMENVEHGAYLWGLYVTDRTAGSEPAGYTAFADFDPDARVAAARTFTAMWAHLNAIRADAARRGLTFAAYCWAEQAENQWLRHGAATANVTDAVETFIASDAWVDLYDVVRRQLITGHSNGLKTFAPLTGFHWRDDDAGGEQAIVWWQHATDPNATADERETWQRRLLTYNEDDVRATLHVRNWLTKRRDSLPSIADWQPA